MAAGLVLVVIAAGCGGQARSDTDGKITVWTIEDVADRVVVQQELMAAFTEATGIEVELVALSENQLPTILASAAAADDLPDVLGAVPLNSVNQLRTDGLLDTRTAADIVDQLGPETFSERALSLTQIDGEQLSVPSDGWAQLLYYRQDLFAEAGLEPPTSYAAIEAAARELDSPDLAGIVASTTPADAFTAQTFEHLALANGCALVDDDGQVTLDSAECLASFQFYTDLIRDYSVAGNQDADTTRGTYFAGEAAMVIWSSFLLDEMAGLREDAVPSCPECGDNPAFLAENTGVVTALQGPDGTIPTSFGEVVSWAPMAGSETDAVTEFVTYMMSDAYLDWLEIAPEGKLPTRNGTAEQPQLYTEAWTSLEAGVGLDALLADYYPADVLQAVADSAAEFSRWGIEEGAGELAGAVSGQFVIPQALAETINAGEDVAETVAAATEDAEIIQDELG